MRQELKFFNTKQYKLVLSVVLGLFLFIFLVAFLPFGVNNYDPDHQIDLNFLLQIGRYVPIIILSSLLNEFAIKPIFKGRCSYTFIIIWSIWSMILLSLITFLVYNYSGDWHDWSLSSAFGFMADVPKILIFPMAGTFFSYRYRALKEKYDGILTNNDSGIDPEEMLYFAGQGTNDKISILVKNFLYAKAQDNYIELLYLKNGALNRFLLRSSLTRFSESLDRDFLVRCHRSFLVNLYNVSSIKGGKNDLQITMNHLDEIIPVSKTYAEDSLMVLKKYLRYQ